MTSAQRHNARQDAIWERAKALKAEQTATNKSAAREAGQITCKLNCGEIVLAKLYEGEPYPVTYANRTQAERSVAKLGAGWSVFHGMHRPFFARLEVA